MINIVLIEPEIPSNTGNIVRTCVITNSILHLIKPLGFEITDKALKRAGLDYWDSAKIKVYENITDFFSQNKGQYVFATTKAKNRYSDFAYDKETYIFFGKETKGIDEELLAQNYDNCIRIPMKEGERSLNLANSVAIVLYEVLRQRDFEGLQYKGKLTKY